MISFLDSKTPVRTPGERDNLQKFECSFENNIKIYVQGMGWKSVVRIYLAQGMDKWRALVHTVTNRRGSFLNYLSNCRLLESGISIAPMVSSRLQTDTQFCFEDIVTISLLTSTSSLNTMHCNECNFTRLHVCRCTHMPHTQKLTDHDEIL